MSMWHAYSSPCNSSSRGSEILLLASVKCRQTALTSFFSNPTVWCLGGGHQVFGLKKKTLKKKKTDTSTDVSMFICWPTWHSLSLVSQLISPAHVRAPVCVFVTVVSNFNVRGFAKQPDFVFCSCLIHTVACSGADDRMGSAWPSFN